MIHTAAELFLVVERTGETILGIFKHTGIPVTEVAEMRKICKVLTDAQVTEIVQQLMRSADHYGEQALQAKKTPGDFIYPTDHYLESCRALSHRAAMWAIQDTCDSEIKTNKG